MVYVEEIVNCSNHVKMKKQHPLDVNCGKKILELALLCKYSDDRETVVKYDEREKLHQNN